MRRSRKLKKLLRKLNPPTTIEEVKEDTEMRAAGEEDRTTITSSAPQEPQEMTEVTEEASTRETNLNNKIRPERRMKKPSRSENQIARAVTRLPGYAFFVPYFNLHCILISFS
ncbi:hypothetical protein TcWFU_006476 [Taenia crassiceps]|uniref:Uncharacterized protein n=1 Tax=Taenia crassiceps TaxID=6207 RepID=A0ABR4QL34_9CEST